MASSFRTKKLKLLFTRPLLGLVLAAIAFAYDVQAEGRKERSARPQLYNHIVKDGDPIDQLIRDRYGRKYEMVESRKDPTYVPARFTRTPFPNPVFDNQNNEVSGSVYVCMVVTTDGRLVDPFIVRSANPLLERPVLEILKEFRAIPARLHAGPVTVVDALKFTFGPAPRRRLDTM